MIISDKIIEQLKMSMHPEGGHFSESFRDDQNNVSLIYYLLKKNEKCTVAPGFDYEDFELAPKNWKPGRK